MPILEILGGYIPAIVTTLRVTVLQPAGSEFCLHNKEAVDESLQCVCVHAPWVIVPDCFRRVKWKRNWIYAQLSLAWLGGAERMCGVSPDSNIMIEKKKKNSFDSQVLCYPFSPTTFTTVVLKLWYAGYDIKYHLLNELIFSLWHWQTDGLHLFVVWKVIFECAEG